MTTRRNTMNHAQKLAVEAVTEARDRLKKGKAEIEARIRAALKEELNVVELDLAMEIRKACELGVPISVIAIDGMGVLDRGTVYRWLKRTEDMETSSIEAPEAFNAFAWANDEHTEIQVRFIGFPTTATADDYPKILEGTVSYGLDVDGELTFSIVEDPMTETHENGVLPGWLTFELEDVPAIHRSRSHPC